MLFGGGGGWVREGESSPTSELPSIIVVDSRDIGMTCLATTMVNARASAQTCKTVTTFCPHAIGERGGRGGIVVRCGFGSQAAQIGHWDVGLTRLPFV